MHKYVYPKRPDLRIVVTDDHPFDINAYLLPFAIVVGICFVIMLVIVVYKCVQDYRRSRRHRLPKSALKKLPIHKFKQVSQWFRSAFSLQTNFLITFYDLIFHIYFSFILLKYYDLFCLLILPSLV